MSAQEIAIFVKDIDKLQPRVVIPAAGSVVLYMDPAVVVKQNLVHRAKRLIQLAAHLKSDKMEKYTLAWSTKFETVESSLARHIHKQIQETTRQDVAKQLEVVAGKMIQKAYNYKLPEGQKPLIPLVALKRMPPAHDPANLNLAEVY